MFIPTMHALGFEDARQWCLARGIRADLARLVSLSFQGGSSNCLEIPLPREATRSMALAYILLMTQVPDDDESKFEGVLVWIRQWGIWSETTERVGMNIVESIRLAKGEARSVDEARAHLFDEHELVEAHALLLQPLFFEWDAFVVPSSGKYFAMADHDGVLKIVTQDQVTHQGLLHRFRDWHPKTCSR